MTERCTHHGGHIVDLLSLQHEELFALLLLAQLSLQSRLWPLVIGAHQADVVGGHHEAGGELGGHTWGTSTVTSLT